MNKRNNFKLIISCVVLAAIAQLTFTVAPGLFVFAPLIVGVAGGLAIGSMAAFGMWLVGRTNNNPDKPRYGDGPLGTGILSALFITTMAIAVGVGVFVFPVLPLAFGVGVSALTGATSILGLSITIPTIAATVLVGLGALLVGVALMVGTYYGLFRDTTPTIDQGSIQRGKEEEIMQMGTSMSSLPDFGKSVLSEEMQVQTTGMDPRINYYTEDSSEMPVFEEGHDLPEPSVLKLPTTENESPEAIETMLRTPSRFISNEEEEVGNDQLIKEDLTTTSEQKQNEQDVTSDYNI